MAGVIDFSKARLRDVGWWRRTNVLIRAMHAEREKEVVEAGYKFQLALVGNGNLKEESFKQAQARAKESFNELVNMFQPWAARSIQEIREEELKSLIDLYKETIGDPSDPDFMRKLESDIAGIMSRNYEPEKESEEARIRRLTQEYEAERNRRLQALRKG